MLLCKKAMMLIDLLTGDHAIGLRLILFPRFLDPLQISLRLRRTKAAASAPAISRT